MRVSWRRRSEDDAEQIDIGRDGLAMLALSGLLIAATGGLTYALAMLRVARDTARSPQTLPASAPIVVLGVQLSRDGLPGSEFRERLDHGAALLVRAGEADIIVLGGVTRPGFSSEADMGKDYLVRHRDVSAERIQCERRSRHTLENLWFYRHGSANHDGAIMLVTSRFHMARACLLARGLGLTVRPEPSDRGFRAAARVLVRLPSEALLIHWYIVGRTFARVTRNDRMAKRIS
ncbi:MAG: YdcF family protein [Acetobacteraceae bacterium]|nr:YdcF family protein [Acetobacteraceae bacterium]